MTPTRRRLLAAALAVAALAALPGCQKSSGPKATPVPPGATVLALGDSLTQGTGAPPEAAYPAVLAGLTGWQVVNAGVSGNTSAQGLDRLPALLAEHRPALVLLGLGGNDLLRRLPDEALRDNLRRAITLAREAGAQVMLIAVPRPTVTAAFTGSLTDHPLYAQLADELGLPLQRQGWSEVLADERLRSDNIHANAEGYAQFAQNLRATAQAVGLLAPTR
ncbi:GDSL-type esterase/lipase family protein [Ideonella sp. A 288]|uniref:GDSL-type esterase/lipase family protein n=1 Tax=Ideonella sp. A 288 TaxID=1962181 RepID=UPI000B4BC50E|nr:GDSL-type esterase/lipase family protein [Ideonella sp. A 288]